MTATESGGTPHPAPDPGPRYSTTTTESEAASVPPVAIIGIGCRVPGAHGAGEFWRLLREGRDAITSPPRDRGGIRRGGYLDRLDAFDNDWFAISEREAAVMDPQQRLGLEVAVEALDDAGVGYRVRGSQTAVLFGACGFDHGTAVLGHAGHDAPYAVTGSALSIIANRLSYTLDLHGPSLVLDSACSSSLAAVDLAIRLLADHTTDLAVVGGVNLPLLPHTSDYLDRAGFLAPDGRCKPFDAAADGYARSDGCTVLILQRTADAHREGNRIYAEIIGAAVGSDGRSNGLYAPNGLAQQQVIRRAWARAGVGPAAAGYIECHGTGTPLGDAVEVGALAAVLAAEQRTGRIRIGSVKSNLGHLEAAAGVTGIAKAALSIAYATIVPSLHFRTEHPLLKLAARGLDVPTEPIGWAAESDSSRLAGVSSFGFGGTNAHVVLRGVDPVAPHPDNDAPVLITITGRDAADLRDRALRWAGALARGNRSIGEFASATARSIPEGVRAALVARDRAEAVAGLLELAAAGPAYGSSDEVPEADRSVAAAAHSATGHRRTDLVETGYTAGTSADPAAGIDTTDHATVMSSADSRATARTSGTQARADTRTHPHRPAPAAPPREPADPDTAPPDPSRGASPGTTSANVAESTRTALPGTAPTENHPSYPEDARPTRTTGLDPTPPSDSETAAAADSRTAPVGPARTAATGSSADSRTAFPATIKSPAAAHISPIDTTTPADSEPALTSTPGTSPLATPRKTSARPPEPSPTTAVRTVPSTDAAPAAAGPTDGPDSGSSPARPAGSAHNPVGDRATTATPATAPRRGLALKGLAHNAITDSDANPNRGPGRVHGPSEQRRRGRILLVFSGQGGQYARMGRGLAARHPVFARALAEAADAVADAGGARVWTPRHGFAHSLDTTDLVQPALFVFQMAMAELLGHWGIRPDAVAGHSLGEIAAAVVAGALPLRDGARIAVARSAILATLDGQGAMAVLEATPEEAWRLVEPVRAHIAVAAVNGPRSVVVSGTPRYVQTLIRRATRRGLYARRIAVDFAAHSPQVHEPAAELISLLDGITPSAPRIPLYSTTRRGEIITSAAMDAKYWAENAEHTVELAAALEAAAADGCTTAIEISPHPVLAPAIRDYPDFRAATHPMADRDDESAAFLDGMARLYLEDRPVDWSASGAFTGQILQRRWQHRAFPLLTDPGPGPAAEDLGDHRVRGVPIVPAMYWLRQLLRIAESTRLTEFTVHEPTDQAVLGDIGYRAGAELVEVTGPVTLATARIARDPSPAEIVGWMRAIDAHRITQAGMRPIDTREFYAMLAARGLTYGPRFRPLRGIVTESASAIGLLGHVPMDTAALDGCLQLIAAAAGPHLPTGVLPLPTGIESAWLTSSPDVLLAQAHAFLRHTSPGGLHCDVLVTDQHGAPAAALLGVRVHYAPLPETPRSDLPATPQQQSAPGNPVAGTIAHSYTTTTADEWPHAGHTAIPDPSPAAPLGRTSFQHTHPSRSADPRPARFDRDNRHGTFFDPHTPPALRPGSSEPPDPAHTDSQHDDVGFTPRPLPRPAETPGKPPRRTRSKPDSDQTAAPYPHENYLRDNDFHDSGEASHREDRHHNHHAPGTTPNTGASSARHPHSSETADTPRRRRRDPGWTDDTIAGPYSYTDTNQHNNFNNDNRVSDHEHRNQSPDTGDSSTRRPHSSETADTPRQRQRDPRWTYDTIAGPYSYTDANQHNDFDNDGGISDREDRNQSPDTMSDTGDSSARHPHSSETADIPHQWQRGPRWADGAVPGPDAHADTQQGNDFGGRRDAADREDQWRSTQDPGDTFDTGGSGARSGGPSDTPRGPGADRRWTDAAVAGPYSYADGGPHNDVDDSSTMFYRSAIGGAFEMSDAQHDSPSEFDFGHAADRMWDADVRASGAERPFAHADHPSAQGNRSGYQWYSSGANPASPSEWDRGMLVPHRLGNVLRCEVWVRAGESDIALAVANSRARRVLVIGESRLAVGMARGAERWMPAERVARDPGEASPIVAATLGGRSEATAVVAVWPAVVTGSAVREIGRALQLLQGIQHCDAMVSLTVVLRDPRSVTQQGIAGLVRSLQLESGRPVRLVWAGAERGEPGPLIGLALAPGGPDEVRIGPDGVQARRFEPVSLLAHPAEIRSEGAYVVTGGLGALGAVAARWLLDSGAGDVVVLTRHPRPLPPLLEGLEDRIVVLRCDVTDPRDLANALHDIRECGPPIRGLIHAAGSLHDAEFRSVTLDMLSATFEPKLAATTDLLDLTATDPIDFALLFSSATGALGAPGQAAYAAANAALDALAASRADRRVISIAWGSWESGLAATVGGAEHLRRAGITPFTTARGAAVLDALRGYPGSHVLAMDYTPTADNSTVAQRLRGILTIDASTTDFHRNHGNDPGRLIEDDRTETESTESVIPMNAAASEYGYSADLVERRRSEPAHGSVGEPLADNSVQRNGEAVSESGSTASPYPAPTANMPVAQVIRSAVAATLGIAAESIGPDMDFTTLGLSSLLAIELRRTLEVRLGIRISTAELFEHPSITMLADALITRLPGNPGESR